MLSSAIRAVSPRSLATKLTLAFLLVSLTGTALVAILVGQITTSEFDKYLRDQMQSSFVARASQPTARGLGQVRACAGWSHF
jgi:hypothetical protein